MPKVIKRVYPVKGEPHYVNEVVDDGAPAPSDKPPTLAEIDQQLAYLQRLRDQTAAPGAERGAPSAEQQQQQQPANKG